MYIKKRRRTREAGTTVNAKVIGTSSGALLFCSNILFHFVP